MTPDSKTMELPTRQLAAAWQNPPQRVYSRDDGTGIIGRIIRSRPRRARKTWRDE